MLLLLTPVRRTLRRELNPIISPHHSCSKTPPFLRGGGVGGKEVGGRGASCGTWVLVDGALASSVIGLGCLFV